ncbi:hypothetical protein AB3016_003686 [Shigella boydii]|uniref:hypothetical protein n=1 Tax=Escherichia coli TaxID=562 RepID=UPI00093C80BF|nr:hypothetical protein [Escherichia coli]EFP9644872.1 hypothetical protein [Shigella boydii]EFK2957336.1 hypothetical protein [Escherichia coli]EFK2981908.1 hypothetical protein [Escherichia coli]EFK3040895.1 hypothetical protein [Escherichia coli]EFK3064927.1 hypothetical protein [Escherichia coli]
MIIQEVTLLAEFRATLMAGGMSKESADKLVSFLEDEKHDNAELLLFNDARLEIAEALSPAWIIRELKGIAKGKDKQAAVAALDVLRQMSLKFYPEFILRTAK